MLSGEPITVVRSLKGAGLAVLLVLVLHKGQAMRATDLQMWTGYADKAITQALRVLSLQGLVVRGRNGYSLVDQFDMWMFSAGANRENHDSDGLLLLTPSDNKSLLINNNNRDQIVNITISPESCGKPVDNSALPVDNFLLGVLESYGIVEPKRGRLARIDGLTAEIVHGLVKQLKAQVGERYTTGLLVHALEAGSWRTVRGEQQGKNKYISGKFADFVEH